MSDYLNFINNNSITEEYIDSTTNRELTTLGPIKRINIFIGANNSRKSRFLRKMLNTKYFSIFNERTILEDKKALKEDIKSLYVRIGNTKLARFKIYKLKVGVRNILSPDIEKVIEAHHQDFNVDKRFLYNLEIGIGKYLNKLLGLPNVNNARIYEKKDIDIYSSIFHSILEYGDKQASTSLAYIEQDIPLHSFLEIERELFSEHRKTIKSVQKKLAVIAQVESSIEEPNKVYIPILRNAIRLYNQNNIIESDIYKSTIENSYKLYDTSKLDHTNKNKLQIFTGLDFYNQIKKARNSRKPIRENFTAFENFVSASFFQNKEIDIVALDDHSEETNHIHIYFDGDQDKQLHHLGDGIQALLILVYPIFMADAESWIFLEEPEINMHPGLLRLFVKTILEHPVIVKKNLRFFLTTHSNHLLDLSLEHPDDVSIFSFKPSLEKDKNTSIIQPLTGISNAILNDLGVSNSSLFMANCSIWVEGPTDRKVLKAFLEAYCKSENKPKLFLEDLHYCFLQYGGSTIANYIFGNKPEDTDLSDTKIKSAFISNKIILIADQDLNGPKGEGKQRGHKLLEKIDKQSDNFTYHTTVANEIENLLSPSILTMVSNHILLRSGSVQESLFDYSDYKSENIGEYLFGLLSGKNSYKFTDGKKLKTDYKNKIADFIVKSVNNETITWEHIKENTDAAKLVEKIHQQISIYNLIN